jgi:hypothetical protein
MVKPAHGGGVITRRLADIKIDAGRRALRQMAQARDYLAQI